MGSALRPGDKCIIVRSAAGNEGKIVIITGLYSRDDPRWAYYVPHYYDVVIRSLGSPLRTTFGDAEQEGPFFSGNLRKLPEAKEDEPVLVVAE